jgi:hypothetical protein
MRVLHGVAAAVLAVVAVAGCDKAKETAKQADKALDESQAGDVRDRVARVKANLAAGRDSMSDCAWAKAKGDAAGELLGLCGYDVPLADATRAVEEAERARAAHPQDPTSECSDSNWDLAAEKLDRDHKGDAAWSALKDRWARACPPM